MTQRDAILAHMKRGLAITPIESLNMCGCFRLAAVIHKLRNDGYNIHTEMMSNKGGNLYASYTLLKS